MDTLAAADVPFLVGGAYAFTPYTGIDRSTKDFDIFVRRGDVRRALDMLARAGFSTGLTFPHWLGKVFEGGTSTDFVDIIFSSGNGVAAVDDVWFARAQRSDVLGLAVPIVPAEELLWSKAFVMERERYDGADVIHLLRARAERLDWDHLIARFGEQWRVLYINLVLFGFVYPAERTRIPRRVMTTLARRLRAESTEDRDRGRVCRGTLLSRQQYLPDVTDWGYTDGRLAPEGCMTPDEIARWTAAIDTIR